MNNIYFDHAATTPVRPEVLAKMLPYFTTHYGNPSGIYKAGRESRTAVEAARDQIAELIGCTNRELYFTGCGTEADNWAIRGAAYALRQKGNHIITTAFEHHAVLHTCQQLEKEGFAVKMCIRDSIKPLSAMQGSFDDSLRTNIHPHSGWVFLFGQARSLSAGHKCP